MSVVIETTLGDITVDLFIKERPTACLNFLKLCKIKYYNYNLFHTVSRRFIAQTGDPTGTRNGGESIFGVLEGPHKRFFGAETNPRIKHTVKGLISFVGNEDNMIGSQFFFTLGDECDDLTYLDDKHCVFGEVAEGLDVVELINEAICDTDDRPYQDIRITHTVVLDDPLPDLDGMFVPSRSPSPSAERLQGGRIAPDEEIDEIAGKTAQEVNEMIAEREAKARATILEMVGDLPDAEMAPPENVLFVCKLNPVTSDDDLEIIFSRFGKIKSCEVIRDHKTGDSLQYAFIEFEDKKSCEEAYFKMDNVLIDDRRIHVDFSQSVSKVKWMGKGRGVKHFPENGSHKKTGQFEENNRRKNDKNRRNYKRNSPSPGRIERRRTGRSRSRSQPRRNRSSPEPRNFKNRSNRRSKSPTNEYKKNRDRRESESRNRRRPRSRSVSPKNKKIYKNTERSRTPERRKNKNNKSRSSSPPKKNRKRMSRSSSTSSGSSTPKNKRSQTPKKIKTKTNRSTYRKSRSHSPKTNKTRRSRSRSLTPKDKRNRSPSEKIETKKNKSSYRSPSRSPAPKRNKTRRRSRSTSSGSLSPKDKRSRSPSVKSKTKKSISYKTNRSRSPEHKTTRNRRRSRSESRSQTPERNKIKSKKNKSGKRKSRSTSPEYKKRRSSSSSSDRSATRKTKQRRNR